MFTQLKSGFGRTLISDILAMAWASVFPSVRHTLDLYQNGAS